MDKEYFNKILNLHYIANEYRKDEYGDYKSEGAICPVCKSKKEATIDLSTYLFHCEECKVKLSALEYIDKMYGGDDYSFWETLLDSMR